MSSGATQPFRPAGTATINASTSAANALIAGHGEAVLVLNSTSGVAFIRFGTDSTVTATNADTPIPPGSRMLLHCGNIASTASVVLGSGSGSVYVTRGDGTVY
jgi:hypothetical protein